MIWVHHQWSHHSRHWVEYNACEIATGSVRTERLDSENSIESTRSQLPPPVCRLVRSPDSAIPRRRYELGRAIPGEAADAN
jgi:hypothetical protein